MYLASSIDDVAFILNIIMTYSLSERCLDGRKVGILEVAFDELDDEGGLSCNRTQWVFFT